MAKNIVLTGLMGAGKSTVGLVISSMLNFNFVDTDKLIEKRENCTIIELFKQKGEEYFREQEHLVIKKLSETTDTVISLGGGSLENETNLINLQANSILFYLKATPECLYNRIRYQQDRPLLANDNPLQVLKQLLEKRELNYLKSNYTINTENKTVEQIAEEIMKVYNANC